MIEFTVSIYMQLALSECQCPTDSNQKCHSHSDPSRWVILLKPKAGYATKHRLYVLMYLIHGKLPNTPNTDYHVLMYLIHGKLPNTPNTDYYVLMYLIHGKLVGL